LRLCFFTERGRSSFSDGAPDGTQESGKDLFIIEKSALFAYLLLGLKLVPG
jgi:hypothetical protein